MFSAHVIKAKSAAGLRASVLRVIAITIIMIMLAPSFSDPAEKQQTARSMAINPTFSVPVLVNGNKTNDQMVPVIARMPTGALGVVWQDERSGNDDIYFSKSLDNGTTFSVSTRVDDSLGTSKQMEPAMAISTNGTIFVVWQDNRRSTYDYDIFLAKSYDGGTKFTRNVKVDDSNGVISWQERPSIAITYNGYVYVGWTDDRSGQLRVRGAYSTDFGATFSASSEISPVSGTVGQSDISLATNGNRIFAAFMDNSTGLAHPYVCISNNGGKSFGAPTRLDSSGSPEALQRALAVAPIPAGGIVAAWEERRNGQWIVCASVVSSHGTVLYSGIRVDDVTAAYDQRYPNLSVDQLGNVYAAWTDTKDGLASSIRFASMKTGNYTFNASVEISKPGGQDYQRLPSIISTAPGRVFVAFQDDKAGTYDIYCSSGSIPDMFGFAIKGGWNLITIPSTGYTYKASTLGLKNGSIITDWNSTTQNYVHTYVVGMSLPYSDFTIDPSTGYWIFSSGNQRINLNGTVPTAKQTKKLTVPAGGGWASLGFESLNTSRWASDIPRMLDPNGNISIVTSYDPVTDTYTTFVTGKPFTDFMLAPGQAYWCFCNSNSTITYAP